MKSLVRFAFLALAALLLVPRGASAQQTRRAQFDQRGSFALIGNVLGHDCNATVMPVTGTVGACGTNTGDSSADVFWRADSPAAGQAQANNTITAAQARSTAMLAVPAGARLTYARLYWSGENATAGTTAVIDRQGGFTSTVTADVTYVANIGAPVNHYEASADVTAVVRANGPGAYRVGDVASVDLRNLNDDRAYLAWAMVVFYQLDTDPPRNLTLFDGFEGITTGMTSNSSITGFIVPATGFDARIGAIVWEGDNTITGDTLRFNTQLLSDASNPMNNFFNGTHSVLGVPQSLAGDLPRSTGGPGSLIGADLDTFNGTPFLLPAATSASVIAASTGDFFVLGGFVTAIATLKPLFTDTVKTFTNITGGSGATGIFPGDVIEYTIRTHNTGSDTGVNVILNDVLPTQVTYVPNSLRITTGANMGALTDAAADDTGEYIGASRTVRVRLGTGATAAAGGTVLTTDPIITIVFRVTVNAGVTGNLSNQAIITADGLTARTQGIPPVSFPSGDGTNPLTPTQFVVNGCTMNSDCRLTDPRCDTVVPRACGPCTNDTGCVGHAGTPACQPTGTCGQCSATNATACTGATPLCNVATATCVGCRTNADCGGNSPICNTTAHVCRPCAMDSECGGATPACHPTGACRQCSATNATACTGATRFCDATPGVCVGCRTNADCSGNTPICNAATHVCRACTMDADCGGATPACEATGVCGQCSATNSTACTGATPLCNVATSTCIARVAVTITAPANGTTITNNRPTITGTTAPGNTVRVSIDGGAPIAATVDASGNWMLPATMSLSNGPHTVTATATDPMGRTGTAMSMFTVMVPPLPLDITAPVSGTTTTNNRPPVTGTTSPNTSVAVSIDGGATVTVTSDAMGNWSVVPSAPLADGPHTIRATATDTMGRTAMASTMVTVDTTAPMVAITAPANGSTTNNNRAPITGTTDPNATVLVSLDGGVAVPVTADGMGRWTLTPAAPFADGVHQARATVTDAAGNAASAQTVFNVDTTPPALAILTPPNGSSTPERQPPVTGTTDPGAMVSVAIDGGTPVTVTADATGHWTLTPATMLANGAHTVVATTADPAGNTARATTDFTVDPTAPPLAITTPANGSSTMARRPPITGTTTPGLVVTVTIDTGTAVMVTAGADGSWSITPTGDLADGPHTVHATTMGAGGGTAMASSTFTVDNTAPAVTITAPANGSTTNNNRPAITGTTDPGATVTVSIDGITTVSVTADAMGRWTLTPPVSLADGMHMVTATARDAAGNTATANTSFTVDTTAPTLTITTPASGSSTPDRRPAITGDSTPGAMVTVTIDGGTPVTVTTDAMGHWTLTPTGDLGDGPHTVVATTSDPAGNTARATSRFNVDPAGARIAILTPPDGSVTNNNRPAITGTTAPNAMVQVSIDGGPAVTVTADAMGRWTLTPTTNLADGPHHVAATTTVAGGNAAIATTDFTVDTAAPALTITAPANGSTTRERRPEITGTTTPGATVSVTIDGGTAIRVVADAMGRWTLTPPTALADGMHTVNATTSDPAGNTARASTTFTVTSAGCHANADCMAAAPVCNVPTGVCGPCRTNADCTTGGLPVCATNGACVQCTTAMAAACTGATPACSTADICVECTTAMPAACTTSAAGHTCLPANVCGCTTDGDCPTGNRCNTTSHRCELSGSDAGVVRAATDAASTRRAHGLDGAPRGRQRPLRAHGRRLRLPHRGRHLGSRAARPRPRGPRARRPRRAPSAPRHPPPGLIPPQPRTR